MADNTVLNTGTGGDTIATDDITTLNGGAVSGVKAQRCKVGFGSDASFRDVDASNGLPVLLPAETTKVIGTVNIAASQSVAVTQGTATSLNATVSGLSSAANITATTNTTVLPVLPFATWSITHLPATATKATISKAAGAAGVRHVCTGFIASLAAGATGQTPITVSIRDGATGAGTVLWSAAIAAPVNGSCLITQSGLCLIGTAATAMTIEFSAAGVAASQETVSLQGFSTS